MKRKTGNMWSVYTSDPNKLFLFTANAVTDAQGCLVMGAGSAKQARDKFPELSKELGLMLDEFPDLYPEYGLLLSRKYNVGAFQTKRDWRKPSLTHVIKLACGWLSQVTSKYDEIHLPYPGIGKGQLTKEDVEDIIKDLPDNVYVWTLT